MALGALTPQDRLSNLCDLAGGSGMSRDQWAVYVDNLAPYTDPCAAGRSDINAFYNLARQGDFSIPPAIVQTPTTAAAAAATFSASCASPQQAGYSTEGDLAWGNVDGTEVICIKGTLKWVAPDSAADTFQAGKVSGQTVLTATGKITPESGSTVNTVIDMLLPDAVADTTGATDGTTAITPAGVEVTETGGAIRVSETYGPDQHGYWDVEKALPAGTA